jgi:hypothetical protein
MTMNTVPINSDHDLYRLGRYAKVRAPLAVFSRDNIAQASKRRSPELGSCFRAGRR